MRFIKWFFFSYCDCCVSERARPIRILRQTIKKQNKPTRFNIFRFSQNYYSLSHLLPLNCVLPLWKGKQRCWWRQTTNWGNCLRMSPRKVFKEFLIVCLYHSQTQWVIVGLSEETKLGQFWALFSGQTGRWPVASFLMNRLVKSTTRNQLISQEAPRVDIKVTCMTTRKLGSEYVCNNQIQSKTCSFLTPPVNLRFWLKRPLASVSEHWCSMTQFVFLPCTWKKLI